MMLLDRVMKGLLKGKLKERTGHRGQWRHLTYMYYITCLARQRVKEKKRTQDRVWEMPPVLT